jgi:hypothetical protein
MDSSPPPQSSNPPEILLSWNATSVPVHERSRRWYTIGGGVLLIGVLYGIFSGAWSFSVVLLLCGGMYALLHNHVPLRKAIGIARDGIFIDDVFTRYEDLAGFWMIETPDYNQLHLLYKSRRRGGIVVQTGTVPPSQIRATLGQFLEELTEKRESLVDIFIRLCKL